MFKEKIEEYISKYHFLYAHDIQVLSNILIDTEQYKANLEKYKENEIENYLKFLESFFLFTDLEVFNGKGLKFIQYDTDYLATPSYARTSIVMTLLSEYSFTFDEILNNNALSKRKLIKIKDVPVMKSGSDMASLEKRVMAIPELTDYYTELLSEICFDNLVRLAAKHIFDIKKDCIKLVCKLSKIKTKEQKKELFYCFVNSSSYDKELLFESPILQDYAFTNTSKGEYWLNNYELLKCVVL